MSDPGEDSVHSLFKFQADTIVYSEGGLELDVVQ